jgi:DNA-binding PadR family transcriptional regulator
MAFRLRFSAQTLLVLQALLDDPEAWCYGYDLSQQTGLKSGTLYPILMRLERVGLLAARWQSPARPGAPPRHLYRLTAAGMRVAREKLRATKGRGLLVRAPAAGKA